MFQREDRVWLCILLPDGCALCDKNRHRACNYCSGYNNIDNVCDECCLRDIGCYSKLRYCCCGKTASKNGIDQTAAIFHFFFRKEQAGLARKEKRNCYYDSNDESFCIAKINEYTNINEEECL